MTRSPSLFEMVVVAEPAKETASPAIQPLSSVGALAMWDDNGNGSTSCAEALALEQQRLAMAVFRGIRGLNR